MNHYAFCFWGGTRTTTGEPHKLTGRYSIAGNIKAFKTRLERDEYVSRFNAVAVNRKSARKYCAGMTVSMMFEEFDYSDFHLED
jgi:hypothetical protein